MSSRDRGSHNTEDYDKSLIKVFSFSSFGELSFLLEKSRFGSLDNYFTNLSTKQIVK